MQPEVISETIRQAIRKHGQNVNAFAKASGVSQSVLQRFMSGERGLTLATAERLCKFLRLSLQQDARQT